MLASTGDRKWWVSVKLWGYKGFGVNLDRWWEGYWLCRPKQCSTWLSMYTEIMTSVRFLLQANWKGSSPSFCRNNLHDLCWSLLIRWERERDDHADTKQCIIESVYRIITSSDSLLSAHWNPTYCHDDNYVFQSATALVVYTWSIWINSKLLRSFSSTDEAEFIMLHFTYEWSHALSGTK